MASLAVQEPTFAPHELYKTQQAPTLDTEKKARTVSKPNDVYGDFNYYQDPRDGSLPTPNYVNIPNSYNDKPIDVRKLLVQDVRGKEGDFTLDKNGFEFINHASKEKNFQDEEQIKAQYYPEVEQLLKDA